MSSTPPTLHAVESTEQKAAARRLIREYLTWIEDARTLDYRKLRLESLKALTTAHALYRSVGFVEIDPYSESSMKEYQAPESLPIYRSSAVFMELSL